jgi:hypothetical protein
LVRITPVADLAGTERKRITQINTEIRANIPIKISSGFGDIVNLFIKRDEVT